MGASPGRKELTTQRAPPPAPDPQSRTASTSRQPGSAHLPAAGRGGHTRVGQRSACQRQDEGGWRHRTNGTQPASGRRETRRRAARRSAARRTARLARSVPDGVLVHGGLFDVVTPAPCPSQVSRPTQRSSASWTLTTPRRRYLSCCSQACCSAHRSSHPWMFATRCGSPSCGSTPRRCAA